MDKNTPEEVFALDIGTRSVVGIILAKEGKNYRILDHEIIEHENRAMYDGQIHNVNQVIEIVSTIKSNLEERNNKTLNRVAVAAAGRALYTIKSIAERNLSPFHEITEEEVKVMEWDAVRKALQKLDKDFRDINKQWNYHCVGYSVVKYMLGDQIIGNLIGQKGTKMSVEVLATFLPKVVVDSLLTVVYKCGFELDSLTLEPIAASYVVIPPNMRQLNVALVDIGAGTSDIAITREGSIIAYGMVPIAGDEITEKLCEEFLLDYDTGEYVKRRLGFEETITFTDILGTTHIKERDEIIQAIEEAVDILALNVSTKIIDINGKLPHAVICIGGGSLTPRLPEKIAHHLNLPKERVGIRGSEIIKRVSGITEDMTGPFAVTPIGIAVNALEKGGLNLIKVEVNGTEVQLFEFGNPTVSDALIQRGISPADIYGAPGMALTFEINGKVKIIKGELGKSSKVEVNGKEATLKTPLHNNDKIVFTPGKKGADAAAYIGDFLSEEVFKTIIVNGKAIKVEPDIFMNGRKVSSAQPVEDGCKIVFKEKEMILSDIFNYISIEGKKGSGKLITRINGEDADFTTPVKDGDKIDIYWGEPLL